MLEINLPTIDPMQAESKVVLGLSIRQILCVVPGLGLGVAGFFALKDISFDLGLVVAVIAIAPAVLMGWARPYQLKFEQYLKIFINNRFLYPPKRLYRTTEAMNEEFKSENRAHKSLAELLKEGAANDKEKKKKKKEKKHESAETTE